MDLSLPVVPLLEVVAAMLLVRWVDLWKVYHLPLQFHLSETFIDQQVVLLMHGSVTALARSAEYFEASPQCCGIEGVPVDVTRPVSMSVMHTNRVDLFFVALDTVRCANVISEKPSLCRFWSADDTACWHARVEHVVDVCKIPVDCVSGLLLHS